MYVMSELTKRNVERATGKALYQLAQMTPDEERSLVKERTGCTLDFSKKQRYGIIGRGNPLLARRRIRRMTDLDKKSKQLFGI